MNALHRQKRVDLIELPLPSSLPFGSVRRDPVSVCHESCGHLSVEQYHGRSRADFVRGLRGDANNSVHEKEGTGNQANLGLFLQL